MVLDVTDPASVSATFTRKIDIVISCLACHSGLPEDFDDMRAPGYGTCPLRQNLLGTE